MQNPELSAPTAVTYTPHALGAHAQVSLVLRPRRRILPDENLTVPLHVIEGEDWEGLVSETCDTVRGSVAVEGLPDPFLCALYS